MHTAPHSYCHACIMALGFNPVFLVLHSWLTTAFRVRYKLSVVSKRLLLLTLFCLVFLSAGIFPCGDVPCCSGPLRTIHYHRGVWAGGGLTLWLLFIDLFAVSIAKTNAVRFTLLFFPSWSSSRLPPLPPSQPPPLLHCCFSLPSFQDLSLWKIKVRRSLFIARLLPAFLSLLHL